MKKFFACLETDFGLLMNSIVNASSFIKLIIPNWYNYRYDNRFSNNYIQDGGFDMFDNGNQVNFITKLLFCFLKFFKHFSVNKNF